MSATSRSFSPNTLIAGDLTYPDPQKFLESIDKTNCMDKLELAIRMENQSIVDKCLYFFEKMGIEVLNFKCDELSFKLSTESIDMDADQLLSFIDRFGQYIGTVTVKIATAGLSCDAFIERVIAKCPHLKILILDGFPLTGTGLKEIHLCPELTQLSLKNCPNLQVFPDFTLLTKLQSFRFFIFDQLSEEERRVTFLGFYEKNQVRAYELFGLFGLENKGCLSQVLMEKNLGLFLQNFNKFYHRNAPEGVAILNALVKDNPQKAVQYVYTLSDAGPLPIEDKAAFIHAVETYCLTDDVNKALRIAIDLDDLELARKAFTAGADVNKITNSSSPLLRATKHASCEMSDYLMENGGEVKFVGGTHDHQTPLSVARRRGHLSAASLARLTERDNGYTDEVFALKLLAHKFTHQVLRRTHLSIGGQDFYLEGFRPVAAVEDYMKRAPGIYEKLKQGHVPDTFNSPSKMLLKSILENTKLFEKFRDALDTTLSSIEYCLDFSDIHVDFHKDAILTHLRSGKPIACFGVTDTNGTWFYGGPNLHAWGLVFIKDSNSDKYRAYQCDRGGTHQGILEIDVDQNQMLEMIETYQYLTNWKSASGTAAELQECFAKGRQIIQKVQEGGVCCYYNLQSIELALLISLLTPIVGRDEAEILAKEIKRYRTSKTRYCDLKDYLDSHLPGMSRYPVGFDLISVIFQKSMKAKLLPYKELIADYALRYASMVPGNPGTVENYIPKCEREAIQAYVRVRNAPTEEEKIAAVLNLIREDVDLFFEMINLMPLKKEELISLVFREKPSCLSKCLYKLGYSVMDAVKICMAHAVNPIDLKDYGRKYSYEQVCQFVNEIEGLEHFKIRSGTHSEGMANTLMQASARGLLNTTDLYLLNLVYADSLTIQNFARCCPKLKTLSLNSCVNVNFNAISPLVSFPHLTDLDFYISDVKSNLNLGSIPIFETCFPNVTTLTIQNCPTIDADFIRALSFVYPNLKSLDLMYCNHVQFSLGQLPIGGFPNLTHMNLNNCLYIGSKSISAFRAYCPNLRSLEISGKQMNAEALAELALSCPDLEVLKISGCQIEEGMLRILSTRFLKLKTLSFIQPIGLTAERLGECERNERIEELDLVNLKELEGDVLSRLTVAFPNLRILRPRNTHYCKKVVWETIKAGFSHLAHLDLTGHGRMTAREIAGLKTLCPNLTSLKATELDTCSLSALSGAYPQLTTLDLSGCKYEVGDFQSLYPICFQNVTELNLSQLVHFNNLISKFVSYCPNLLNLTFKGPLMTRHVIDGLARTNPKLRILNLIECKGIDSQLLQAIATRYPGLDRLNLSKNSVGSSEIQVLAQKFPNLTCLDLSECYRICSEDLQVIAAGLPELKELNLASCYLVDESAIEALRICRPNLTILI